MSETTTQAPSEAIFALMARLADNKFFLGRRYAEWCSSAPTLESSVAAAAMAQDELGHARAIYPVLKTLAPDLASET
ncbi:MAG TPA: Phenylacetic acid catabolic protein, partial [Ktedonobacterales bacterium]